MFGSEEILRANLLELNASDDRGINVIRERVKNFAKTLPIGAKIKIIILDEADALTFDAQHALRRMMEMYAEICRFILIANYVSRIIAPIQSRCAVFRFSSLDKKIVSKRLAEIAEKEGIEIDESGLEAINFLAQGDLRKSLNILEAAGSTNKKVTADTVYEISGYAHPQRILEMLNDAITGKFLRARQFLLEMLYRDGLMPLDIIREIFHVAITRLDLDEKKRSMIVKIIGESEINLVMGSDGEIQLSALLAKLGEIGGDTK